MDIRLVARYACLYLGMLVLSAARQVALDLARTVVPVMGGAALVVLIGVGLGCPKCTGILCGVRCLTASFGSRRDPDGHGTAESTRHRGKRTGRRARRRVGTS